MSEFCYRKMVSYTKKFISAAIKEVEKQPWAWNDVIISVLDTLYQTIEKTKTIYRPHACSIVDDGFVIMVWSAVTQDWEIYITIVGCPEHVDIVPCEDTTIKALMTSMPIELKDDFRFNVVANYYRYLLDFGYRLVPSPQMIDDYHVTLWHRKGHAVNVHVSKTILEELNSDPACLKIKQLFVDSIPEEE